MKSAVRTSRDEAPLQNIARSPYENWTMGQILRVVGPSIGLRNRLLNDPYLDQVRLGQVIADPLAQAEFMLNCRQLPGCGNRAIERIRAITEILARGGPLSEGARPRCNSASERTRMPSKAPADGFGGIPMALSDVSDTERIGISAP
jgi:hypothetical protein